MKKEKRVYFLETSRMGFSRWCERDLPLAVLLWGEEAVSRYISKTGVFSLEEIKDKLMAEISNEIQHSVQYWPMFELNSNELIGCCGLRLTGLRTKPEPHTYEIGFHLRSKYWGKGLALEAATRIIDYAFGSLGAETLIAGHNPNNVNSKKVLAKLGFIYTSDMFYPPTGLMHPTYVRNKE